MGFSLDNHLWVCFGSGTMAKNRTAHVVTTQRTYKGKTYKAHLLRRSYREKGKVKKETIANITSLGDDIVALIRKALSGKQLFAADELFEVKRSYLHGQAKAVLSAMSRLGFDRLLASRKSKMRSLAMAMVASQIIEPDSKLAMPRTWSTTTLPQSLGVEDADEDDLYEAMDWLLERQPQIEKKLAARHLSEGSFVLYDLSSSYFEGKTCPLAKLGHNRDGKKGKLQVNYGLVSDRKGRPLSVSVYEGNTGDPKTLLDQVGKVREQFGVEKMVLVGDRGMISQKQIDKLREVENVDWLTALRTDAIRKLVDGGSLQLGLFDERNIFEFEHEDFPGERLVACRNPELAKLRAEKRRSLMEATSRELDKVKSMVARGRLRGQDKIGVRTGKIIDKYKVAKHFDLSIEDDEFSYKVADDRVRAEAALDGVYVVRTSAGREMMNTAEAVLNYKRLSEVERAFRTLKSIDLMVRPIRHRVADRVRAHIFICMLAYYVRWHMMEAWRPLLFADEDQEAKELRDPVDPADRSDAAYDKLATRKLEDGTGVHSFRTLMASLRSIVRNECQRTGAAEGEGSFEMDTTPTREQQRALDLLLQISV
jgi:transposase